MIFFCPKGPNLLLRKNRCRDNPRNQAVYGMIIFLIFSLSFALALSGDDSFMLDRALPNEEKVADFAQILVVVTERYRLPMVIELAQPLPSRVRIAAGRSTARQLLNSITTENPDYGWRVLGSVVHVYHKSLRGEPRNFLNWKIDKIELPDNIADLELALRARVRNIQVGMEALGGLVVGVRSSELAEHKLSRKTFHNISVRELLMQVAETDHGFYSLVIFPTANPRDEKDLEQAFVNWRWRALPLNEHP